MKQMVSLTPKDGLLLDSGLWVYVSQVEKSSTGMCEQRHHENVWYSSMQENEQKANSGWIFFLLDDTLKLRSTDPTNNLSACLGKLTVAVVRSVINGGQLTALKHMLQS